MKKNPILVVSSTAGMRELNRLVNRYKAGELSGKETVLGFKATSYSGMPPTQDVPPNFPPYNQGKVYKEKNAVTDRSRQCARGLYAGTLAHIFSTYGYNNRLSSNRRLFIVEFRLRDVAAIPHNSDGKYRMSRIKLVRDVTKLAIQYTGAAHAVKTVAASML
jgi:hypothetical protein